MPDKPAAKKAKAPAKTAPKAAAGGPPARKSAGSSRSKDEKSAGKPAPAKKAAASKEPKPVKKEPRPTSKTAAASKPAAPARPAVAPAPANGSPVSSSNGKPPPAAWVKKQRQRLIELRDSLLDAMEGVARDTLRARPEGSEASAFGMHQADAGSDAYDRDFALNMLSKEQDALYEIEEALRRVEQGTYGRCEMSGKWIPQARLEAIPFARYTVECQAQLEKENRGGYGRRAPVRSLFGLGGDEDEDSEGDDSEESSND